MRRNVKLNPTEEGFKKGSTINHKCEMIENGLLHLLLNLLINNSYMFLLFCVSFHSIYLFHLLIHSSRIMKEKTSRHQQS